MVTLAADAAYVIGSPGSATVDIEDDDRQPAAPKIRLVAADFMTSSNHVLVLSWNATTGQRYQVQHKSDWTAAGWIDLGTPVTATNVVAGTSDVIQADELRFYRVVLLP